MKRFEQIAEDPNDPVAPYFQSALDVLQAPKLLHLRGSQETLERVPAFDAAVETIVRREFSPSASEAWKSGGSSPLLLVAIDHQGEVWPGDDPRLVNWLLESPERLVVYGPKAETYKAAVCALCGIREPLFPNALANVGLNFVNGAFQGSFPDMRTKQAWRRFAICARCADLLHLYKNYVAPEFVDRIVGSDALIIPSANIDRLEEFGNFLNRVLSMMERESRAAGERRILSKLVDVATVATISILWAKGLGQKGIGQKVEGIRGFVTHVLPSRLAQLEKEINTPFNARTHPFYPQDRREDVRRKINLNLNLAQELLRRPGGEKYKTENQSTRRRALLIELAECVFHGVRINPGPLWHEIERTAQAYWTLLLDEEASVIYQCQQEAPRQLKAGKWQPLTLNGWVRHLYFFLDYLSDERVNVLPKETEVYQATQESLRPLLSQARGLDTDAKRFAFLLGVLYGHLIYVQAKKAEVNVTANALSWMRGGRLRAAELPELCGKITSKLLEYDALTVGGYRKWETIHALEAELAHLGTRVGGRIDPQDLPDEQVLYFLMLGIALSYTFTTSLKPKTGGQSQ